MELNNHSYTSGVFFQCLVDAYRGKVLRIKIDDSNHVDVDTVEIKPTNDNDNNS